MQSSKFRPKTRRLEGGESFPLYLFLALLIPYSSTRSALTYLTVPQKLLSACRLFPRRPQTPTPARAERLLGDEGIVEFRRFT